MTAAPPDDPVVCVLVTPDDWAPMWQQIAAAAPEDTHCELVLIDGAPAYPVQGLRASVAVHASGSATPMPCRVLQ